MAEAKDDNQPTHDALWVEGDGKNKVWNQLGAAWPHEDGDGYTIQLKTRPFRDDAWDGRIILRKRKPKEDKAKADTPKPK